MKENKQDSTIPSQEELKTVFLHNFSNKEISLILSAITKFYPDKEDRKKLVFARTTEKSLQMKVNEWIIDTAEDHLYLIENPPSQQQKQQQVQDMLQSSEQSNNDE